VALAALLCGCAAEVQASPGTTPSTDDDVHREIVQWNDGLDHLVVTFVAETPAPAADEPAVAAAPDPVPVTPVPVPSVPVAPSSVSVTPDDDSVLVVGPDGEIRRQVRDGSLRLVVSLTAAERAAVEAAADAALAVVVEDPDGAVGPPGRHYLMTPGRLEFLGDGSTTGTAAAPTTAAPTTAAPTTAAPTTAAPPPPPGPATAGPDAHREALLAVPGVVSVERLTPDTYAVATSGDRAAIEAVPGVETVVGDLLVGLFDDPNQPQQWWLENKGTADAGGTVGVVGADVKAAAGWRVSRGAGVVVAVLDTGVEPTHPDLIDRMWTNSDEVCNNGLDDDRNGFVDDCAGWDFGSNDKNPAPDAGVTSSNHGTHVAGIVAASSNGLGVVGLAPEATIMPVKLMSTSGVMTASSIYGGIVYAVDNGASVINLSLGTAPNTARSLATTIETGIAYARSRGVTVVAAAGNSAVDIGVQPVWPANYSLYYDNVITVAATTNRDTRASFSNYGAPVTIAAPGLHLYSTLPGSTWGYMSGTSMAAPVVAGAVADLLASPLASAPSAARARLAGTAASTSVGPRLDLGAALGGNDTRSVRAVYEGADALVPDTVGTLGIRLQATQVPPSVVGVRMHLATLVGGQVYAVTSLPAVVSTPSGSTPVTSGDDGSFPVVPLANTSGLATTTGLRLDLAMELPAGDFAVVTELVDTTGAVAGGTSVGYLTVAAPSAGGGTPTTSSPASSTTVAGPTTTASAGTGTTAPGPGTTAPGTTAPGTTAPGTTAPGTTAPGTTAPGTTAPGTTAPGTTAPGTTAPGTTAPGTTAPGTTAPGTTAPGTTAPGTTAPGTTAPVTTAPVTTAPVPTTPVPTTPVPDPDTSGPWRVDSMSPRLATIDGGTTVVLNGVFPTTVPVYLWFGDLGIVQAVSTGSTLTALTPAVAAPAITDVSVRFRTGTSYTLTLADAFTFIAGSTSTTTTTTTAANTTSTTAVGATTTTTRATGTTTSPVTTSPVTTSPVTTSPVAATTTTVAVPPTLGSLKLRAAPSTGSLSRVSAASWPAGCRTASCSSSSL
jgi:subtilisin family serine protease